MQLHTTRPRLACLALATLVAGCGGSDSPTGVGGVGTVNGLVVAADGTTPIQGAAVTLAAQPASGPSATTGTDGAYTLTEVPAGEQALLATRGLFQARFNVTVTASQTVTAPAAKLQSTGKLAFVAGSFDNIEGVVRDALQNPMDELQASQLGTASVTSQYKMIFLNCGFDSPTLVDDPAAVQSLKDWVANGGILYVSDLALDVVVAMFPSDILSTLTGDPQDLTASVTSTALQSFTGKSAVQLRYDLPGWTTPDAMSSVPQVLLTGTFNESDAMHENKPLAVVIPHGQGKVVFTSFHNEAGATTDQIAVLRFYVYGQ